MGKRVFALLSALLLFCCAACSGAPAREDIALVPQALSFAESPVDVPNPDRGFYRACDELIVPVSGAADWVIDAFPAEVCGIPVQTALTHLTFDLGAFSENAPTALDEPYDEDYRAPAGVSVRSRGDDAPWDYDTHLDYWIENVLPRCPRGVSRPLTDSALGCIRGALEQIRAGDDTAIVRFCYDSRGYSWVSCEHPEDGAVDRLVCCVEPDRETILTHVAQLAPVLHDYEDVLTGVDGGFFGPWGEMHSTALAQSPEAYAWLLDALLDAVPAERPIAVHPGAFLSWYNARHGTHCGFSDLGRLPAPQPGTSEARFGFFNDSYAFGGADGEPDDCGSLSEGIGWPGAPFGTAFDRASVIAWVRRQNSLYGGEAWGKASAWNALPYAFEEAARAQTDYLNADYSAEVHRRWADFSCTRETMGGAFDPAYDGKNGLEFWRDRLGYRLVLRAAALSVAVPADGALTFRGAVQNVGFGCVVNRKDVDVLLKSRSDGAVYTCPAGLDARLWLPDPSSRSSEEAARYEVGFSLPLAGFGSVPPGEYDVFLRIRDPKETSANRRCIRFANDGVWDAALGANRLGTFTVTA